jgi:hypothetical protein
VAKYCKTFSYNCSYCSRAGECKCNGTCRDQFEIDTTPEQQMLIFHFLEQKKQNDMIIRQLRKLNKEI